jgi:hypothetical protein
LCDIVDGPTHGLGMNGQVGIKGAGGSTVWREGRKGLEGLVSGSEGDLVGFPVGPLFPDGFRGT